jgi:hypothetical protein
MYAQVLITSDPSLGNLLVLFVYSRTSSMKTPSNRLLISLSLADLLMMSKSWVLVINMWNNGPFLGLPGTSWRVLPQTIQCRLEGPSSAF